MFVELERTCPFEDDPLQARPRYITRQGSVNTGSQGQEQSFHGDRQRRRRGCPASVWVSSGDPRRGPRVPEPKMGCPNPGQNGDFVIRGNNLSEPAPPPKTTCFKSDHASSSAKAPSTWAAKAKDNRSATDDDTAAQSQPKSRLVTPAEDPGHESPDQAGMAPSSSEHSDDDNESHLHLQVLLCDELRQWVGEHKIESQGKRPTRIDLIKAIAGAAKSEQPSKEDIESIVTARKSKCSTKAA
ncbi:hypothetical protein EDB85DRAFT_1903062 [Lactarius pseudohatsudake]|nr:hypothetical protein EDB85DRAFT_1903062 [Lactarius pseudohatsudake]